MKPKHINHLLKAIASAVLVGLGMLLLLSLDKQLGMKPTILISGFSAIAAFFLSIIMPVKPVQNKG